MCWHICVHQKRRGRILIRALDITYIIIILEATIGFVNGLGIFNADYYATQNNTFINYEISDLEDYSGLAEEPSIGDYANALWGMAWDALWVVMKVLFAVVIIIPDLIRIFAVPTGIAALIQLGIYYTYYLGWQQYRSGKSYEAFQ